MLPVFTRPLGSRKAIFSSWSTLYCLSASATDPALDVLVPLDVAAPLTTADAAAAPAFFARTRSAHDLGAAGLGGEATGADSGAEEMSSVLVEAAGTSTEGASAGAGGVAGALGDDVFGLVDGMLGTTGIIGMAVLVFLRARVCGGVSFCGGAVLDPSPSTTGVTGAGAASASDGTTRGVAGASWS